MGDEDDDVHVGRREMIVGADGELWHFGAR